MEPGRLILLDVTIDKKNFILLNIYAPTKDKQNEKHQRDPY